MDLREIAAMALDEFAEDAVANPADGSAVAGVQSGGMAAKLDQSLQKHDDRYHGGHYDGGKCTFRDNVAAQAKKFGVADKLKNLGRDAESVGTAEVEGSEAFEQYKTDRQVQDSTFAEKLRAMGVESPRINGTGYTEEQMEVVGEWQKAIDERRDKYLEDTLGDSEAHCVDQLATLIDAGGEKGEKALALAEEISQKYPDGDPRHTGAEKMKDRAERKAQKDEFEKRMAELDARQKELDERQKTMEEKQKEFERQQKEQEKKNAEAASEATAPSGAAEGGEGNAGGSGLPEYEVDGKTYVDVSGMGFWEGMKAAWNAGLEGKDIVTDWDKMNGRWDEMKRKIDKKHAGNMDSLQGGLKDSLQDMLFKDALGKEGLSNEQKAYVESLYEAWKAAKVGQKPGFVKRLNDYMRNEGLSGEAKKEKVSDSFENLTNSYDGETPDTSIYEEVPADERDTSFMDEKKAQIEKALSDAGINATITNAINGPSVVQFDIQRADNRTGNMLANVLNSLQQDLGVTITYEPDITSGKQRFGHIRINNPKTRDAGLRRLLEHPNTKAETKDMMAPFLAGETPEGEPVWIDLSDHGFMGGDTGSGKSERIRGGLAGAYHVKTPNQLQVLINAHANSADYANFADDPHTAEIAKTIDGVVDNLSKGAAEWKRREKLFNENGVQNLRQYNAKMASEGHIEKQLPQLMIITDEATNLLSERPDAAEFIRDIVTNGRKFGVAHFGATQDMRAGNIPTDLKGSQRMGVHANNDSASKMIFDEKVDELKRVEKPGGMMVKTPDGVKRIRGTYAGRENLRRLAEYNKTHYNKRGSGTQPNQPNPQSPSPSSAPSTPPSPAPSPTPPAPETTSAATSSAKGVSNGNVKNQDNERNLSDATKKVIQHIEELAERPGTPQKTRQGYKDAVERIKNVQPEQISNIGMPRVIGQESFNGLPNGIVVNDGNGRRYKRDDGRWKLQQADGTWTKNALPIFLASARMNNKNAYLEKNQYGDYEVRNSDPEDTSTSPQ